MVMHATSTILAMPQCTKWMYLHVSFGISGGVMVPMSFLRSYDSGVGRKILAVKLQEETVLFARKSLKPRVFQTQSS